MKSERFRIYAWAVLAYNLLVVLWGAFVRATGSGAGCGSHWPLCNGEAVPRDAAVETLIEFTHRVTSGLALVAVALLVVWAFRAYPSGHRVRGGSVAVLALILIEALLGAGLVLFELVADDDSMLRAGSMIAHLVNTFLLVGALALTAWWASGGRPLRLRRQGGLPWLLLPALLGVLLIGASGAVAALGDTLFPSRSLAEGWAADLSPASHFLLRLRLLHPVVAVVVGAYLLFVARVVARRPETSGAAARGVSVLVAVQLLAGAINVLLLAPVWLQLVHLLLADLLWISLVILAASALQVRPDAAARVLPMEAGTAGG
ncbi:MAG TPA: COX15/CtaA family protein [Longimicrobium sp.]|nr:COX15/CtaA family protein [Longimicrobium sp.]